MKAFRISGRFRMGRSWQPFSKELAAQDEAGAREKLFSILGSQHGVPRKYVSIAGVEEVPKDQVEDHAGKYALEAGAGASARRTSGVAMWAVARTRNKAKPWPHSRWTSANTSKITARA